MATFDLTEYKSIVEQLMKIDVVTEDWFPPSVTQWIQYNSTLLGVPETYISYPLVSAVTYCSQHATVSLEDGTHDEPVLLYALVGGRSGTNKSAALRKITDMVMEIENSNAGTHVFDTGTSEGLMKAMYDNRGTILSPKDEFASFNDAFDKTASGNMERSRFLSLYSCTTWSRITKNNGSICIEDPRFSLISFTQPFYMINFAKTCTMDGFFQRFMTSIPKEKFVKRSEKKLKLKECANMELLDMNKVLSMMYEHGKKNKI